MHRAGRVLSIMASSRVTRRTAQSAAKPLAMASTPISKATVTDEIKESTAKQTKGKKRTADSAPQPSGRSRRTSSKAEADPSELEAPAAKKARRSAKPSASAAAAKPPLSALSEPPPPPSTPKKSSKAKAVPVTPRPADPAATNAPLATPGGGRRTAYARKATNEDVSAPAALPAPRATTANLLEQACAHLVAVDPRMQALIDAHPCPLFTPAALARPVDPFAALVRGILSQQVSGAAAASIGRRFVALFAPEGAEEPAVAKGNGEQAAPTKAKKDVDTEDPKAEPEMDEHDPAGITSFPQPAQVLTKDITTLRSAGLSQRKAEYVLGLAKCFVDGELNAELLATAGWEEVLERLTSVRGLGVWSAEMFGCFALKRMDIFSTGDLGVQRGLAAFVGRDVKKLRAKGGGKWKYMSEKEMLEHSAKFAPYRTLFMWYMWRVEDVNLEVLENA